MADQPEGFRGQPRVIVIGAGPGGICAGVRLKQRGLDFTILEKADGVGGVWRHNRYPGCACDVQCHLYSYSFELRNDWSRPYPPQPEILQYFEDVAAKYDIVSHCRFNTGAVSAEWDHDRALWRLTLNTGEMLEAEVIISGVGLFNEPNLPDIAGLDSFAGTMFHSSRWPADVDLAGKTVGVIGSAASGVQLIPHVANDAARLHVFQRTPNWVLPKEDNPFTPEQIAEFQADPTIVANLRETMYNNFEVGGTFRNEDVLADRERVGIEAISQVHDPADRQAMTPDHRFGCKRPLFSNTYYPTFNKPHVELVTEGIASVNAADVVTYDGTHRDLDVLILATGFQTLRFLSTIQVTGRNGLRLSDAWSDGPAAYVGCTTSGFPNLFMLYGPNTNNGAIIIMLEHQVGHAMAHIDRMIEEDLAWVDVRPDAMAAYNDEIQEIMSEIKVWDTDCNNYYRAPNGRIVTQWPSTMRDFHARTKDINPAHFEAG